MKENLMNDLFIFLYFTNQYYYIDMCKLFVPSFKSGHILSMHMGKLQIASHGSLTRKEFWAFVTAVKNAERFKMQVHHFPSIFKLVLHFYNIQWSVQNFISC